MTKRRGLPAVAAVMVLLASVLAAGQLGSGRAAEGAPNRLSDRMQVFSAQSGDGSQPTVIFVDGGPGSADPSGGAEIAEALAERGVNVALTVARTEIETSEAAREIAAGLSAVAESFGGSGPERDLFVFGRGRGAEVVAKLILDPSHLPAVRGSAPELAGVITLDGDFGAVLPTAGEPTSGRSDESALPRMLLLTRDRGPREFAISARRLAKALRASGADYAHDIVFPRDPNATLWGRKDLPFHLILDFVGAAPLPQQLKDQLHAEYLAKSPSFSNDDIWESAVPIERHSIDDGFMQSMGWLFADRTELLRAFPLDSYYSVDLLDYLETLPDSAVGTGDYLVITNIRGQRMHLTRAQLEGARPQLVIGIDDERNLFRIAAAYRTRRDYSWLDAGDGPRPWLMRTLGAFLYAPGEAGAELFPRIETTSRFGLVSGSFRWQAEDPYEPFSDLSPAERETVVSSGCVECHAFRGVGGLGYHIGAFTGEPEAGLALPLTEYPGAVMERFLFDQKATAARMGVVPVPLDREHAAALLETILQEAKREQE